MCTELEADFAFAIQQLFDCPAYWGHWVSKCVLIYVTPQLFSRLFWHALKNVAAMALMVPEALLGPQTQNRKQEKEKILGKRGGKRK